MNWIILTVNIINKSRLDLQSKLMKVWEKLY